MSRQKHLMVGRVLLIAAAAVLLSGCLGFLKPSLEIEVEPDPIVFTYDELTQEKEIMIWFTTKGLGVLELEEILFELFEPDAEEPVESERTEIGQTIPVIPWIREDHKESISLPESFHYATEELYEQELKGQTYTLRLTITTDKDTIVAEIEVKFE